MVPCRAFVTLSSRTGAAHFSTLATVCSRRSESRRPERTTRSAPFVRGSEFSSNRVLHSDLVRTRHADLMFELRVGIHTGTVLLGGGVDGEHTIRGMTVNIAARMEQTAPVGGLRITHATFAQVRGVFDVTEEAPLLVKGHDGPIGSYLVHRAKPRAFRSTTRGIEGVEHRMIGREVEREKLQAAFKGLLSERKPVFVTVVAEAGVGSSRLLYEFQNWAELRPERYLFFQGRAFAKSQVQPYALIRDVFAWRLQIGEGEAIASARAKLEQEIVPLFVGSDGEEVALSHASSRASNRSRLLGKPSPQRHSRGRPANPKPRLSCSGANPSPTCASRRPSTRPTARGSALGR